MKRSLVLIAAAALVGFASTATAATITITTDKAVYNFSESILLTVTASSGGELFVGSAIGVTYDSSLASNGATAVQSAYPAAGWFTASPAAFNGVGQYGTHNAFAFVPSDPGTITSTGNLVAGNTAGFLTLGYGLAPPDMLLWGNPNLAANPSVLTVQIVPEPTTAAMLGLGLFGIALTGRRRA